MGTRASEDSLMDAPQLLQQLHACPEPSGSEEQTAKAIAQFLEDAGIRCETGIGGHGILCRLGDPPYRLLRSELDAIPHGDGARHGCGHDGHMTMLATALTRLHADGVGGVAALFQPSEEDGSGMARCLEDPRLAGLDVKDAFAIHNVPGLPLGQVELGPGALASTGTRITITGQEAHAASPETGRNPYPELHALAAAVPSLGADLGPHALATLIHVRLGQEAYGTSPGTGVVAATLRGTEDDVAAMRARWLEALPDNLQCDVTDVDPFPETRNTEAGIEQVRIAAKATGLSTSRRETPYGWSEDVGHAVAKWGGALIGLGSGEDQPPLHDNAYTFPADLLEPGIRFWCALGGTP